MKKDPLTAAWEKAAEDLGITVRKNVTVSLPNGKKTCIPLLIERFGTLITTIDDMDLFELSKNTEYYCSALNPKTYAVYKRDKFISTLCDWRYFGPESEKPEWYVEDAD